MVPKERELEMGVGTRIENMTDSQGCFKSIRISISRRRKTSYPLRPLLSL